MRVETGKQNRWQRHLSSHKFTRYQQLGRSVKLCLRENRFLNTHWRKAITDRQPEPSPGSGPAAHKAWHRGIDWELICLGLAAEGVRLGVVDADGFINHANAAILCSLIIGASQVFFSFTKWFVPNQLAKSSVPSKVMSWQGSFHLI